MGEVEELKKKLQECQEDADEERNKSTGQRIQLLDEVSWTPSDVYECRLLTYSNTYQLNSLQAEVADLRKQLRAKA